MRGRIAAAYLIEGLVERSLLRRKPPMPTASAVNMYGSIVSEMM